MRTLKVKAFAKINLYLRVVGKRSDGYHDIETVFQSIGLADELVLETHRCDLDVRSTSLCLPPLEENLVYKAAKLLRSESASSKGATITLEKSIPLAAGLAGGSADAAATLAGLNLLWDLDLPLPALQEIGAQIGADVPFCLQGGTALGKGRGDKLEALPLLDDAEIVLAKPNFSISSEMLYQVWDKRVGLMLSNSGSRSTALQLRLQDHSSSENCSHSSAGLHPRLPVAQGEDLMREALASGDKRSVGKVLANALEAVAIELYPEIGRLKETMLKAGALGAQMSGSGPTVFALADSRTTAEHIARSVNHICPYVLITKTQPHGYEITE